MDNMPFILDETGDFAVVFKPPKMHSRGQGTNAKEQGTLFSWYSMQSPLIFDIMHRLDYETQGLVLFAKNNKSHDFFKTAQDKGEFTKEYSAVCQKIDSSKIIEGFPEKKLMPPLEAPFVIESYFRPFGPGRKLVRPVTDDSKKHKEIAKNRDGFYKTEIKNIKDNVLTVQIKRGFRHQIRCHLCWIGFPILNDPLYPVPAEEPLGELSLRAHALYFPDPGGGKEREYRIQSLC
ncbi:MAG: RNA pseudouridine synthase [Treponema sp.]|nr:RNA pseudouridine synthase [Treponema sp.]